MNRWEHRHTVLVCCVVGYFGVRFIEFVLSLVFADIKHTLGVSSFVIGLAVTASTVTYAAVQLPSGALGDHFGERSVILWSLGLTGTAGLVLAVSPSGVFIVLGMALVGLVSGAYYSPATALLTDLFDGTGRAIGIHRLGGQFVGFTGLFVPLVVVAHGWRVVLGLGSVVAVCALVGVWLFVRPRPSTLTERSLREQASASTVVSLLSRPPIAFTTAIAAFAQFAETAAFSFLPLLLSEYHGLSTLSGVLFTGYFVAVMASQPVAGWLSDRFGRDPVTVGALLTGTTGFVGLAGHRSLPVIAVAVGLVGLGMGWSPPVQSRAMDRLNATERGTGFGLVRTVYIGFAALNGIVIMGVVSVAGWQTGLGVLAVVCVLPATALVLNHAAGWNL